MEMEPLTHLEALAIAGQPGSGALQARHTHSTVIVRVISVTQFINYILNHAYFDCNFLWLSRLFVILNYHITLKKACLTDRNIGYLYIYLIHIWFLVCCVALVLLHSVYLYFIYVVIQFALPSDPTWLFPGRLNMDATRLPGTLASINALGRCCIDRSMNTMKMLVAFLSETVVKSTGEQNTAEF